MAKKALSLVLALLLCVSALPLRGLAEPGTAAEGTDGPVLVSFHEPQVTAVLPDGSEVPAAQSEDPDGEVEPLPDGSGDEVRAPDPRSAPDPRDEEARERSDDPDAPDPVRLSGEGEADQPIDPNAELTGLVDPDGVMYFDYLNLSNAGAAQVDDWASGEYPGVREQLEGEHDMDAAFLKTRLMVRTMNFNHWDYQDPAEYFIPYSSEGSRHELTLYGYEDVEPEEIEVLGVRLMGEVEKHVYGDEGEDFDGRLFWYTVPIFVPANDTVLDIHVKGEPYAVIPLTHVSGQTPYALVSTMQVYDYEEGPDDTVTSMTLRYSGFNLPDDPACYIYTWWESVETGEEEWEEHTYEYAASTVSEPDENGYRLVRFEFGDGTYGANMIWGNLYFRQPFAEITYPQYFFDEATHLTHNQNGDLLRDGNGRPCFRTEYNNSESAPFGNNVSVPCPYYCIFREPEMGEDPEVMPTLSGEYYNPALGMSRTYLSHIWLTVHPGSYEGGSMTFSDDIGGTGYQECTQVRDGLKQMVYLKKNATPEYGVKRIWVTFSKEGLKTVKVGPYLVEYIPEKAPTPTNPGCMDPATGQELASDAGVPIGGAAEQVYRFYVSGAKGCHMYLYFCWTDPTDGQVYQTDSTMMMAWNEQTGRYELDLTRGQIPPDAEIVRFQILSDGEGGLGGYKEYSEPCDAALDNPEPGFRLEIDQQTEETVYDAVSAYLYPKAYLGGAAAVSLDGGQTWGAEQQPDYDRWITFTLPEPGDYDVYIRFSKQGLTPFVAGPRHVYYNDGSPAAPTEAFVEFDGERVPQKQNAWVISGAEEDEFTFCASAEQGRSLEAIFRDEAGNELFTRDMAWSGTYYTVKVPLSALHGAAAVSFRVKAGEDGKPGRPRTIELRVLYLKALYAPSIPYELKQDAEGERYFAVAPGAAFSGVFEAPSFPGLSHRVTLAYQTGSGAAKTVRETLQGDDLGQFQVSVIVPNDAGRLTSLSYELVENGEVLAERAYPLDGWRVWARTFVTGIPMAYADAGASFSLKGDGVDLYAVLTADNYASLDLGDLPGGSYTYEITGRSGHVLGGTADITRGKNLVLSDCPALGSLTVTTAGEEVAASLRLSLVTPDGEAHSATGAVGVKLNDLPVGTSVTVAPEYDSDAYPEIIGYSPANKALTINGNESAVFTFTRASFRSVTGKLVRADRNPYASVRYVNVVVEQTVMRNGEEVIYRTAGRTDFNGNFTVLNVYDGIEAAFQVSHYSYALTEPCVFTASGAQDEAYSLGELEVDFSNRLVVPVRLWLAPMEHVDAGFGAWRNPDGSLYVSPDRPVLAESAILPISSLSMHDARGNYSSLLIDRDFDLFTTGGNHTIRLHEGVVPAGASLNSRISAMSFPYGDSMYAMNYTDSEVQLDDNGNAVLDVTAWHVGGEVRATVAPEGSGLIGVLMLGSHFVYGTGELSVPYGPEEMEYIKSHNGGISVYSCTVRPEEADELIPYLQTRTSLGADSCVTWQRLRSNCVIHLTNMTPAQPVSANILGPYRWTYQTQLSVRKGYVLLTGTLEKRYPDAPDDCVVEYIEAKSGPMWATSWFDYSINGQPIYAVDAVSEQRWDDAKWHNTQDAEGYYRPTNRLVFQCEVPMDSANHISLSIMLHTRSLTGTDADGKPVYRGYKQQPIGVDETVSIFDLSVPDALYIREEQEAQRKTDWTATVSLRTYVSEIPAENEITIWDNGVAVDTFTASAGSYNSSLFVRHIHLTDNQSAGLHTLWATRPVLTETGETETLISYSQSLPVLLGGERNRNIHVTNIQWIHYNHRKSWDENDPECMWFWNAADFEGKEIWIWPSKRSDMYFNVMNATKGGELEGVNFVYECMVKHEGWDWYDNMGNHGSRWLEYWYTTTVTIPCAWYGDYTAADGTVYSRWGFDNKYLGYVTGFSWEFVYKAEIDTSNDVDLEARVASELEALYQANDLGNVPDDAALAGEVHDASAGQINELLTQDADLLPDMFWDLSPTVTESDDSHIVVTAPDTGEVQGFRIEMREGELIAGPQELNEQIYKLMELEREEGSQDPDEPPEDGWQVYWAKTDSLQGATLIRMAVREVREADGRYHYSYHRRVYLPVRVAEALTGATLLDDGELLDSHDEFIERADRGKKVYDTFNDYFTYADLGNTMYVNQMEKEMRVFMGSAEAGKQWGEKCSFISDRAGKTMAILGVADAAYTYYKGPDGKDGTGLRQLLEHVQDERFRAGIERQIKDYEEMRQAIFNQDMTMKTVSSASNFASLNIFTKVAVFLGGLGNSYFSDKAKEFNQQVYDTTLLDIQRQIRFEKAKASRPAAEAWLRAKMDSIYGKGNWSEYALEEERKLWVLVTDEDGSVHYVWHERAGQFNPYWDPAGFVFEGVEDNKLEGVTATLYFTDQVNEAGEPVDFSVWTDETGAQRNPLQTEPDGSYMWMVPNGWWKVRYEMDGYLVAESKPMRVPPIHTQVNVGLLSTEAPTAKVSVGDSDITVVFSKYMQLESLIRLFGGESYRADSFDGAAFTVQFYDRNGAAIPGTVTFPDKAANTGYKGEGYGRDVIASDWFVRTAVFTPDDPDADLSGVSWVFADGMVSYSGVALNKLGSPEQLYRVTLDAAGGVCRETALLTAEDGTLRSLPTPTREGCEFRGWRTPNGVAVDTDYVFTADTALTAVWAWPTGLSYVQESEGAPITALIVRNGEGLAVQCAIAYYDAAGRLLRTELKMTPPGSQTITLKPDGAHHVKAFLLNGSRRPVSREAYGYFG